MDWTLSRPGCLLEIQPQPTLAPGVALASHLKLCNQVVLRIGTETRASRNLDTAIGHRHGLGEWCGGELGKHPLEWRIPLLDRDAMQHRQKSGSDIEGVRYQGGARLLDLGCHFRHSGDAHLDDARLNVVGLA